MRERIGEFVKGICTGAAEVYEAGLCIAEMRACWPDFGLAGYCWEDNTGAVVSLSIG